MGDRNKSSPVRLSLEISFALSLMAVTWPTTTSLLPGYLLTDFARYWLEAGANPKARAEWCSLLPDLSQFQGPGPRSGCCQLSHQRGSTKKQRRGKTHLPEGGAETPSPPFTGGGGDGFCAPEEPSREEDSSGVGPEEKSPGRCRERKEG